VLAAIGGMYLKNWLGLDEKIYKKLTVKNLKKNSLKFQK
jgi:hypothetical protein